MLDQSALPPFNGGMDEEDQQRPILVNCSGLPSTAARQERITQVCKIGRSCMDADASDVGPTKRVVINGNEHEFMSLGGVRKRPNYPAEVLVNWLPTWETVENLRGSKAKATAGELILKKYGPAVWEQTAADYLEYGEDEDENEEPPLESDEWEFVRLLSARKRANLAPEVKVHWTPTWENIDSLRGSNALVEAKVIAVRRHGLQFWEQEAHSRLD